MYLYAPFSQSRQIRRSLSWKAHLECVPAWSCDWRRVIAAALKLNVVGANLTDPLGVWVGAGSHFDLLTCHLGWRHSLLFNRWRSDWVLYGGPRARVNAL
jgi:hypothetical protein